jgi:hypothetical protein
MATAVWVRVISMAIKERMEDRKIGRKQWRCNINECMNK